MISKQQNQNMAILDDEINCTNNNMDEIPTNLSIDKTICIKSNPDQVISKKINCTNVQAMQTNILEKESSDFQNETRIQLSFSVDRLLNDSSVQSENSKLMDGESCCEELNGEYSCCTLPNCLVNASNTSVLTFSGHTYRHVDEDSTVHLTPDTKFVDMKSIVRPTPVRAIGNNTESGNTLSHYSPLTPTSLIRFHHAQMQQKQLHQHLPTHTNFALSALMNPMCGIKSIPTNGQQIGLPSFPTPNRFSTKSTLTFDIPTGNEGHLQFPNAGNGPTTGNIQSSSSPGSNTSTPHATVGNSKRKRSWSRAVFSNLQRKGLEIQFQQQKYITKPDRRKLAARLNLTDAQVKVWFQNRRMKWRHTRENLKSGHEKQPSTDASNSQTSSLKAAVECGDNQSVPGYSSDGSSSAEMSDIEDEEDEIDVVE